jgi:hypothetical protein
LTELVIVDGMSGRRELFDAGRGERVHTPPVAEDMVHVRTMRPQSVMVTAVLVKMVEHLWSQSWPMERSELDCREEKMCAKRVEAGRQGILIKPVCELEMVAQSGRVTVMLSVEMETASRLLETLKKMPVAPVLMTVVVFVGREGVDCVGVTIPLVMVILLAVGTFLTGPLYHEPREVREDPVRGLGTELAVVPPIMLVAVVATWWPSPGQRHAALAHAVIDSRAGIWTKSVGRSVSRSPDNKPEQRDEREYLE